MSRTVYVLGVASLLTDVSSEMIYPLLPAFLTTVLGAGALSLGLIEGLAETAAAFFKIWSGVVTDRFRRRKPLIVAGYGLSGVIRPLIGLAPGVGWVLGFRFVDRIGKGIRSSPRDALIADVTPESERGRAYGLHRAMDHAGAVAGPLLAALLLGMGWLGLRGVFLAAAVPAALVILVLVFGVREPVSADVAPAVAATRPAPRLPKPWRELGRMPPGLLRLLACLAVFTLGNATDAFLLLRLTDAGVPLGWLTVLWAAHSGVKMLSAAWGGRLADRYGHRRLLLAGWLWYALAYGAFAVIADAAGLIAVFLAYGVFHGMVEPAERAMVAAAVPPALRGTAFGCLHFTLGLSLLPASLLFGWLWEAFSPTAAFAGGAGLALLAAGLLTVFHRPGRPAAAG